MRATVLIACDLGESLLPTLEAGIGLADRLAYAPVLLHVDAKARMLVEGLHNIDPDDLVRMRRDYREMALETLQKSVRSLGRDTQGVEILVREGRPEACIFEAAVQRQAALIVVGADVHGVLEHLFVGRTTNRVVRSAPCPVLVARLNGPWPGISRILYATDLEGTEPSPSERFAARLGASVGAHLALVHVSQLGSDFAVPYTFPPRALDSLREVLSRRLELVRQRMLVEARELPGLKGIDSHLLFAEDTARSVNRAAAQDNADLVIVGTHGRTGLARALIGSVAEGVLRHATTSVLVVPSK